MSVIQLNDLITQEALAWPDKYKKDLEEIIVVSKKLGNSTSKKNMTELEKVQRQLSVATERSTKEFIDQKAALNTLNTSTRMAVKDVQNLDNAYDRLSKELNDTRKAYKNLSAEGKTNTKEAKAQLAAIRKLDNQLKKIDNSVGQNQRSVGGYTKAIRGIGIQFIAWAAAIGTVFRALGNAFNRVRKFDKSIVELTAILGKSRKEIQGLEQQILKVASASTKTSSEVADLAVALVTLGKTQSEVELLLEPVNNLSIALKATSEEAGLLLVGTLNAFGESAREAQRYGDVIAKMRTSSALDFEKIKDALSFLSPTANAVGLSIERTGAILGTLVNSTVKASRAGRLMSSTFARLVSKGMSLDEALTAINNSTDKVKTSTELFGVQSFSLGLILAKNVDKVNELDISLQNSAGTLQALTDQQLTSLDAKLKILDSAWERFILTITAGDNFIANDFKASIRTLTGWFESLADSISGTDRKFENWKEKVRESKPDSDLLAFSIEELNKKLVKQLDILGQADHDFTGAKEKVYDYNRQLKFLKGLVEENTDATEEYTEVIEDNTEATEDNVVALKDLDRLVAKLPDKLSVLQKGFLELTDHIFGKNTIDQDAEKFLSKIDKSINKVAEKSANARAKELQNVREAEEQKNAIISQSADITSEIGNRVTDLKIQQIAQELTALEFARNRELESVGDNERAKYEINKKFDNERKRLQRQQAASEKSNALFQIAINTAVAVSKAWGQTGIFGIAAQIPVLIMGAIQAAAVLSAPIPEFDEGTERTPKDYIAGEKRPELRKAKGKWSVIDKPTLFKNSPGDKIVSGKETDSILGSIADMTGNNMLTDKGRMLSLLNNEYNLERKQKDNSYKLQRSIETLTDVVKNKKEVRVNVNTSRSHVYEKNGNVLVNRVDKYYRR